MNTLSHSFTGKERSNPSFALLVLLRGHSLASSADCELDAYRPRTRTNADGRLWTPTVGYGHLFRTSPASSRLPPQSHSGLRKIQLRTRKSKPVQASPTLSNMHFNNFFSALPGVASISAFKRRSRRVREVGRSFPMNLPPNPSVILTHGSV